MDWLEKRDLITLMLKKYRWAAIVLLTGLILMAIPEKREPITVDVPEASGIGNVTLEQELENLLSKLDGAGKVTVLLTQESGERVRYQVNEDISESGSSVDRRRETVIITDASRNEEGLIWQKDPPIYRGAVVLCQGGDRATVRLAIVTAVGTATGLSADKITVLKMK